MDWRLVRTMRIGNARSPYRTLIPLALLVAATAAHAQEVRVSIDAKGDVERIDREMEEKLSLFPTYENFQEALLYQLPDSSYALEVFYNADGKFLKRRMV